MKKLLTLLITFSLLISLASCAGTPAETTLPEATSSPTETSASPETTRPPETVSPPETTVPPTTEKTIVIPEEHQKTAIIDPDYNTLTDLPEEIRDVVENFLHAYLDNIYLYTDADYHQYTVHSLQEDQMDIPVDYFFSTATAESFMPRMDFLDDKAQYWKETRLAGECFRKDFVITFHLNHYTLTDTYARVYVDAGMSFYYLDRIHQSGMGTNFGIGLICVNGQWVVCDLKEYYDGFDMEHNGEPQYQAILEYAFPADMPAVEVKGIRPDEPADHYMMNIVYAGDRYIVFNGCFGLFGYDLQECRITFSVDPKLALGMPSSGTQGTFASAMGASDGSIVMLYDKAFKDVALYFNPATGEMHYDLFEPMTNRFNYMETEWDVAGSIGSVSEEEFGTFSQVCYLRGDEIWLVFEDWDYD